jgi:uncharacterized protein (TIGR00251 family)
MADAPAGPVVPVSGGCLIRLHIQPRASRTEIVGLHGDALKLRIAAPPVDGEANEAVIRFLAEKLGVPRSAVTLERGASSRAKTVRVVGIAAGVVAERLAPGQSAPAPAGRRPPRE